MSAPWSVEHLAQRVWIAPPAVTVLLAVVVALNGDRAQIIIDDPAPVTLLGVAFILAMFLSLVLVGALIAARRPHNPIGWLLLKAGLLFTLAALAQGYAFHAIELGRSWPGATVASWIGQWLAVPAYVGAGFLFLLFPDGRLPSPRWRGFAGIFALLGAAYTVAFAVEEWPRRHQVLAGLDHAVPYVGDTVTATLWPALMALLAAPVASVFLRYRRGAPDERAQIRWLAPAGAGIALGPLLAPVEQVPFAVTFALSGVGGVGLPVAIGIAILRYRLYAIDRIISRTVTYGLVIAVLGAVYAAGVVTLGAAVSGVSGREGSDLAVAASTLAAIALFRPVRSRVRAVVDRRFNRTGFLARRVVETFPERLRDEIDVEAIRGEIAHAAAVAVRPATASVWLADRTRPDATHSMPADPARPSPDPARQP